MRTRAMALWAVGLVLFGAARLTAEDKAKGQEALHGTWKIQEWAQDGKEVPVMISAAVGRGGETMISAQTIEAFWNAHIYDWSVLDFSRHGKYDRPMGALWDHAYQGGPIFFVPLK